MPGGKNLRVFSYQGGVVQEELPLTIREAKAWDAEAILALTRAAYARRADADPPYKALLETAEDVQRHIENGGAVVAVTADMEGEHVVGAIRWRVDGPGVLLGYRLAVSPDYQHRGIAGKLLERLDRVARMEECGEIHLHVRRTSPELVGLYAHYGYHLVDAPADADYNHPVYEVVAKRVEARKAF